MTGDRTEAIDRARRLVRDGQAEVAVELLGGLLRDAPDDPELLLALGRISRAAGLLDAAEAAYRSVLDRRPDAVMAAIGLSDVLVAKGATASAIHILSRIHLMAPGLVPAAMSLAAALQADDRPAEALAVYDRIAADHAGLAQLHGNRAEALARLGRYGESLATLENARRLDPDDPRIGLNHAFALLLERRTEAGLAAYEARLDPALPTAPLRRGLSLPRWHGGVRPDGPLLVASEQGLGDEIRFAALTWTLAQDGVPLVVEAEPRLVALFRRSLPGARVVAYDRRRSGVRPIFSYHWLEAVEPRPTAWIEACSLALRLGLGRELGRDRPVAPSGFLRPDESRGAGFREWLRPHRAAGSPLIGIVWGSARSDGARRRFYPPIDAWAPVLAIPGARFVDLQYTDAADDRQAFRERHGVEILPVDILDKRNDLDGAAALAAALDAVVGVSSSVSALAGAVGTPTVEVMAERIWLPRTDGRDALLGPIRFAETETPGDWTDAMQRAAMLLGAALARS